MKKLWLCSCILLLPACGRSQQDKLTPTGQLTFNADIYMRDEKSRNGVMLIKDWQNRAIAGYEVVLSCVTPGLPSMPNPLPSVGMYHKPDGGRCYVYIQERVDLKDLKLDGIEIYVPEGHENNDEDFDQATVPIIMIGESEDHAAG